jgi:hypothetical protein
MGGTMRGGRRWRVAEGGGRWLAALAVAVLLPLGAAACRTAGGGGSGGGGDRGAGQGETVELNVRNDNSRDMDVYVVSQGLGTRLGTVTAVSSARFTLDASYFPTSGDFRIVATPIGGNGRASSGNLIVHGGQRIDFTIAPLLRASSASVR